MKITLNLNKFQDLIKKGYSIDVVFMLFAFKSADLGALCNGSAKISALYQSLTRKGLITESGDKLTTIGEDLLKYIPVEKDKSDEVIDNEFVPFIKKKIISEEFLRWWNEFPPTNNFSYKGREFQGCRTLRQNKDDCKLKFDKILFEGEYTADEIIEALKLDVFRKKEQSVRTGENKFTYMQNSLTYLNQLSFESYIEDIRMGKGIENAVNKTYDGVNG
jgi:hypothetical protein